MSGARAYYNEHERYAAQWLRNLIAAGHIAPGDVDERSIEDVCPADLAGYTQCHFFAGLGGWPLAFRLAGWPDDRPVWSGSCPCQPFSAAGKGGGFADERHLWPAWHWLIEERHPGRLYGEQVASGPGLAWWDLVSADLEALAYAVGECDLPAASVRAPGRRQRLWWLADDDEGGRAQLKASRLHAQGAPGNDAGGCGELGELGDPGRAGLSSRERAGLPIAWRGDEGRATVQSSGALLAHPWDACDWLPCRDGKRRPVEPGTFPLADGVPARVGQLRAYGNAIVPQVAVRFILASDAACAEGGRR